MISLQLSTTLDEEPEVEVALVWRPSRVMCSGQAGQETSGLGSP
jgi:hypothetical protein